MSSIEYRVVWDRPGYSTPQYEGGFRSKDLNWGAGLRPYEIHPHQVIRWEERTISDWRSSC